MAQNYIGTKLYTIIVELLLLCLLQMFALLLFLLLVLLFMLLISVFKSGFKVCESSVGYFF